MCLPSKQLTKAARLTGREITHTHTRHTKPALPPKKNTERKEQQQQKKKQLDDATVPCQTKDQPQGATLTPASCPRAPFPNFFQTDVWGLMAKPTVSGTSLLRFSEGTKGKSGAFSTHVMCFLGFPAKWSSGSTIQ